MHVFLWVLYAVIGSYVMSYCVDIRPKANRCPHHYRIFFLQKTSLFLSVLLRSSVAASAYLVFEKISLVTAERVGEDGVAVEAVHPSMVDGVLIVLTAYSLAKGIAPFVKLSKKYVSSRWPIMHDVLDTHDIKGLLNLDHAMWSAVCEELANQIFWNLLEYSRTPESRLCTAVVFEEYKEFIMRRQSGHYSKTNDPCWLHSFVLAGYNHPQRAEYLVNTVGVRKTNRRMKKLKAQIEVLPLDHDVNHGFEVLNRLHKNYVENPDGFDVRPSPDDWKGWVMDPQGLEEWLRKDLPEGVSHTRRRGSELAIDMLEDEHRRWLRSS